MARVNIDDLERWRGLAAKSRYRAKSLSMELQISRRQLERYTRRLFGLGPQRWLNGQRLANARELLMNEGSVKSVAYRLGYKWVSQFSREFKSHFGHSPRTLLPAGAHDARDAVHPSSDNRFVQGEFRFR